MYDHHGHAIRNVAIVGEMFVLFAAESFVNYYILNHRASMGDAVVALPHLSIYVFYNL